VNLHVSKGHTRQIRLIQNAFTPDGDAGARPQAVSADGILYADLDQSDVCAVTRAWVRHTLRRRPWSSQVVVARRTMVVSAGGQTRPSA
jgi:hypothetical protein